MSEETMMVLGLFFLGIFMFIAGIFGIISIVKNVQKGMVETSYKKQTYLSKDSYRTVHTSYSIEKNPIKFIFSFLKEIATALFGILFGIAAVVTSIAMFLEQ